MFFPNSTRNRLLRPTSKKYNRHQKRVSIPSIIKIGPYQIGQGNPCLIIAEVAQAHDGSLGLAHSFIERAAQSGIDAIKFQTHIAQAESTLDDTFRIKFSYSDTTRYDYWKRMEFTREQWQGLKKHADEKGLLFLSSAFSIEAVELLQNIGMPAWKVGSGEISNRDLLKAMMQTGKPLLISTGMSSWDEIEKTNAFMKERQHPYALFQCTSQYPTPLKNVGLNVLEEIKRRLEVPVGLSDHSGTPYPSMAAMACGANLIELHVTFDKAMFGPDASSSVTFEELDEIVRFRDAIHEMNSNPVEKDEQSKDLESLKNLFGRSVCLKQDLPKGTVIEPEMLTFKKPGTGIPADQKDQCTGKKLVRNVSADRLLTWKDLE